MRQPSAETLYGLAFKSSASGRHKGLPERTLRQCHRGGVYPRAVLNANYRENISRVGKNFLHNAKAKPMAFKFNALWRHPAVTIPDFASHFSSIAAKDKLVQAVDIFITGGEQIPFVHECWH
jgi:hypothetical protein